MLRFETRERLSTHSTRLGNSLDVIRQIEGFSVDCSRVNSGVMLCFVLGYSESYISNKQDMKNFTFLLSLIFVGFSYPAFGQDSARIISNPRQRCLLAKASLTIVGDLKLGADFSQLEKAYPELRVSNSSPIPDTTA